MPEIGRLRQFLIFVLGGGLSAIVDIGLMQSLLMTGTAPLVATSVGFAAGLLVNFAFHAKVTFKQAAGMATLLRFLCVVGLNYLMTMALVACALHLGFQPLWGKLASLPLVAFNGFLLSRFWIFK